MTEWKWISKRVALAVHGEQLAEHGGLSGIRDEGLLESALARPQNVAAYGEEKIENLAAAYATGIARNHPFIDGNKRTAFVAMELFLGLNGYELKAGDAECVTVMLQVAAGEMAEETLAAWIKENIAEMKAA